MPGSVLIQMHAKGPIERVLYGNPHITFFKTVYKRPTNFASRYLKNKISPAPKWNDKIYITVPKEADLLGGVYVRIKLADLQRKYNYLDNIVIQLAKTPDNTLLRRITKLVKDKPDVEGGDDTNSSPIVNLLSGSIPNIVKYLYSGTLNDDIEGKLKNDPLFTDNDIFDDISNDYDDLLEYLRKIPKDEEDEYEVTKIIKIPQHSNYCNGIGAHMIEYIELTVGGKSIEKLSGEWLLLHNELHTQSTEAKKLFNKGIRYDEAYKVKTDMTNLDLIVPIPFFFTKDSGSYLPILSMSQEEIVIVIKLRNFEDCITREYMKKSGNDTYGRDNLSYEKIDNNILIGDVDNNNGAKGIDGSFRLSIPTNDIPNSLKISSYTVDGGEAIVWKDDNGANEEAEAYKPAFEALNNELRGMQIPITPFTNDSYINEELVESDITELSLIFKYFYIDKEEQTHFISRKQNYIVPIVREVEQREFRTVPGTNTNTKTKFNDTELKVDLKHPVKYFVFIVQRKDNVESKQHFDYSLNNEIKNYYESIDTKVTPGSLIEEFNFSLNGVDLMDEMPATILTNIELLEKFKTSSNVLLYAYSFALFPNDIQTSGTFNFSNFIKQYIKLKFTEATGLMDTYDNKLVFRGYYVSYNVLTIDNGLTGFRYI